MVSPRATTPQASLSFSECPRAKLETYNMENIMSNARIATIVGEIRMLAPAEEQKIFVLKPMLQLGAKYGRGFFSSLELVWYAYAGKRHWKLFVRATGASRWRAITVDKVDSIEVADHELHRLNARIKQSASSREFEYKLLLDDELVFTGQGKFPQHSGERQRTVVFGDFADGARGAYEVAKAALSLAPDLVVMPGDIVYKSGLFSEYRKHLDPVLNGSSPDGVALCSSTVVVAAAGNHDVRIPDHEDELQHSSKSDLFAYFRTWRHPESGPKLHAKDVEEMVSKRKEGRKLLEQFGPAFIKRSNFSFFQGDVQWVVLDANKYMDWRNADLQSWLRKTLRAGRRKTWQLVCFHQPGFNSDAKYRGDWRMRVLNPIFEEYGVDVVFHGHCHFYERHRPLKFHPNPDESGKKRNPRGVTTVDLGFDGKENRKPDGVIHIVTGAGGTLLSPELRPSVHGLSDTTAFLCEDRNSLSVLEFGQRTLTIRQVDTKLEEIDRIVIEKD